ncbi:MAG: polyprenyl synthetase family protein [Alphaproteobacteria bacterium]|nr:polyprenyl synthetase family protein [Alphaproteobacteria bacterium]
MTDNPLAAAMAAAASRVEDALAALLPDPAGAPAPRLAEAMRYAVLGGGKRLRPFLILEGARICGVPAGRALRSAAAVELVHCYSLVHDDLPAMDDDDLRRGRPTVHKAFDEATAILAGDALLTFAFEVLADPATHPDGAVRAALVAGLARAAGGAGMCAGQALDLAAERAEILPESALERLARLKTGALIAFSAQAGAILAADEAARAALAAYGEDIGLAFQIADDLLDVIGDAATVGKGVGRDAARGKQTLVGHRGVARARAEAAGLAESAARRLDLFGDKAEHLRRVAHFTVSRRA